MKTLTLGFISFMALLLSHGAIGQEAEVRTLKVVNPPQATGIHIGDVLDRELEVRVSAPYQISQQALPLKGLVRDGIELADIQIDPLADHAGYRIKLRYRVFASAHLPTLMALPAESFALTGGEKALSVKLPAWPFWFSPLVPADIQDTREHLIPQFKPSLVEVAPHQLRLAVLSVLLAIGLLGLLYINAHSNWLPFMNGAFAQAHHRLKKLPRKQASVKAALAQMHQAFNRVHGGTLFEGEIAGFLEKHPQFRRLAADIEQFFRRSNQALFGEAIPDSAQFIGELTTLSKRLRDCERRVS